MAWWSFRAARSKTAQIAPYNPLGVIVDATPNNIINVMGQHADPAVVAVAVILGICMNKLGEKARKLPWRASVTSSTCG